MTIAIGLLASDGLVLAADRQHTAGTWKADHGKMLAAARTIMAPPTSADLASHAARIRGTTGCLLAGAGNVAYMEALMQQLRKRFLDTPYLDAIEEVEPVFAGIVEGFHRRYIQPIAIDPDQRPKAHVIVGCLFSEGHPRIWVSEENILRERAGWASIGIGWEQADTWLTRLYRTPILDVWKTVLLVAAVMYHVKNSVDGCGKRTDIACLQRSGSTVKMTLIPHRQTNALEATIGEYFDTVEPEDFRWLIGEDEEPKRKRRAARVALLKLIDEISAAPNNG